MGQMKAGMISCLDYLISEHEIKAEELRRYLNHKTDCTEPEQVRQDLEEWFRCAGFEQITGRKMELSECPFSRDELALAAQNNEIILCIPHDMTRSEIAKLFHFENWAVTDELVTLVTEKKDLWFKTKAELKPTDLKVSGLELSEKIKEENLVPFCLERYMIFVARIRYLYGVTPDREYWIWLPAGRYDRSGMLIAGFDRFQKFNVHGWMPQFRASFLGARYGVYPKDSDAGEAKG